MKQYSKCCSCTSCVFKSPSNRLALPQFIDGKRYFVKLPLHKQKPPLKRRHATQEFLHHVLVPGGEGSDQFKSNYTNKSKEHTGVFNRNHLFGTTEIRSSNTTKPCRYCNSCSYNSTIEKPSPICPYCTGQLHTQKCRNTRRKRFSFKICTAIRGIRSNPKNVFSAPCLPCLCKTFMTHSSNALAISGFQKSDTRPKLRSKKNTNEVDIKSRFLPRSINGCLNSDVQQRVKKNDMQYNLKEITSKNKINPSSLQNEHQSNNKQKKYSIGMKSQIDYTNSHLSSLNDIRFACLRNNRNPYNSKKKIGASHAFQTNEEKRIKQTPNYEEIMLSDTSRSKHTQAKPGTNKTYINTYIKNSSLTPSSFCKHSSIKKTNEISPKHKFEEQYKSMQVNTYNKPYFVNHLKYFSPINKRDINHTCIPYKHENLHELRSKRRRIQNSCSSMGKHILVYPREDVKPLIYECESHIFIPIQSNPHQCTKCESRNIEKRKSLSPNLIKRLSLREGPTPSYSKKWFQIKDKKNMNKANKKPQSFRSKSSQLKTDYNIVRNTFTTTNKDKYCVESPLGKCSHTFKNLYKTEKKEVEQKCYIANTETKNIFELFRPDYKVKNPVYDTEHIKSPIKTCKCTSLFCIHDTLNFYSHNKKKRNQYRNKIVSTVNQNRKHKKSMTSIHCQSRSTQSGHRMSKKRTRSECYYWPFLENDWVRPNFCFHTDFCKGISTSNMMPRNQSANYQTVSDLPSAKKRKQHNTKLIPKYRTLQEYNTHEHKNKLSSYSDCILKMLTPSKVQKQDYLKSMPKYDFRSTFPCHAIEKEEYNKPISTFTKQNQYVSKKEYATKSLLTAKEAGEYKIRDLHRDKFSQYDSNIIKRRHIGIQTRDLKAITSIVTKSCYDFKNNKKIKSNYKHIILNKFQTRDSVGDNRRKVSKQKVARRDYVCIPDLCFPYRYHQDQCLKRRQFRLRSPQQSKTIVCTSRTVASITKKMKRKSISHKYAQTDDCLEVKIFRDPQDITVWGTPNHSDTRLKGINSPQYKNILEAHNLHMRTRKSKCDYKKHESNNYFPRYENIVKCKYKADKAPKTLTWQSTSNYYAKRGMVNSKDKQKSLHQHSFDVCNISKGKRKNLVSKLLSISPGSYRPFEFLHRRRNRVTRSHSQSIPKKSVKLENNVMNHRKRHVNITGPNINMNTQLYKRNACNLDHMAFLPKEGPSVSNYITSQAYNSQNLSLVLLKKLSSLYNTKMNNDSKNTRLYGEENETYEEIMKKKIHKNIPIYDFLKKNGTAYKKYNKPERKRGIPHWSFHENTIKPKYPFSENDNVAQIKDIKSKSYASSKTTYEQNVNINNSIIPKNKPSVKEETSSYRGKKSNMCHKNVTKKQANKINNKSFIEKHSTGSYELLGKKFTDCSGKVRNANKSKGTKGKFLKRRNRDHNNQVIYTSQKYRMQRHLKSKSTSTLLDKLATSYSKSTLTKLRQLAENVNKCKPHVCTPGECDSKLCFEIFKSKTKKVKNISKSVQKNVNSKSIGTSPNKQETSITKSSYCVLKNKNVMNMKKPEKSIDYSVKDTRYPFLPFSEEKLNKQSVFSIAYDKGNKHLKNKSFMYRCFSKLGLTHAEKERIISLTRKPAVYERYGFHKNYEETFSKAPFVNKQDLLKYNNRNMEILMPYSKKKFKKSTSKMSISGFYEPEKQDLIVTEMSISQHSKIIPGNRPKRHKYIKSKIQNAAGSEFRLPARNKYKKDKINVFLSSEIGMNLIKSKHEKKSNQNTANEAEKRYISATEMSVSYPKRNNYLNTSQKASENRFRNPTRNKNNTSKYHNLPSSEISFRQVKDKYNKKRSKQNILNRAKKQSISPTQMTVRHPELEKQEKLNKKSGTESKIFFKYRNKSKNKKREQQNNEIILIPNTYENLKKKYISDTNITVRHTKREKNEEQEDGASKISRMNPKRDTGRKKNKRHVANSNISLSIPYKDIHKKGIPQGIPTDAFFPSENNTDYPHINRNNKNNRKIKKEDWYDVSTKKISPARTKNSHNNDNITTLKEKQHVSVHSKSSDTPVLPKYVQHLTAITKCIKSAIVNMSLGISRKQKQQFSDHSTPLTKEKSEVLNAQQTISNKRKYEGVDKQNIFSRSSDNYKYITKINDKEFNTRLADTVHISPGMCCKESPVKSQTVTIATRSPCLCSQKSIDNSKYFKTAVKQNNIYPNGFSCNKKNNQYKELENNFKQTFKNRKPSRLQRSFGKSKTQETAFIDVNRADSQSMKIFKSHPCCNRGHHQLDSNIARPKSVPGFLKCLYKKKSKPKLPNQDCPICLKNNLFEVPPDDVKCKGRIKKPLKGKTQKNLPDESFPIIEMVVDAETMKVTNNDEIYRNFKANFPTSDKKQDSKMQLKRALPLTTDLLMNRKDSMLLNGNNMLELLDENRNRRRTKRALTMKTNSFTMSQPCQPCCHHRDRRIRKTPPIKIYKNNDRNSHREYCTCCICSSDPYVRRPIHPKYCTCCICKHGRHLAKIRSKEREKDRILSDLGNGRGDDELNAISSGISSLVNSVTKVSNQVPNFAANLENIISQLRVKPCSCGLKICKKEKKKLEELRQKGLKINAPPECVCGSKVCKLKHTKQTPYYKEKEIREKKKALKKKKREKRLQRDTIARIKRYSKEDALMRKRIKRQDKKAMKALEKYENYSSSWTLLAENAADVGRFGINTTSRMITSFKRCICHPRYIKYMVKQACKDPKGTVTRSLQDFHDSGYSGTVERVTHRCSNMETSKRLISIMESHPVTSYLLHFRDKNRKRRILEEPIKETECKPFLRSLRKKPCLWLYRICPWFYPHCLNLLSVWRQFTDVILFLLAVVVWSPCILCTELCRIVMCCLMCAGL